MTVLRIYTIGIGFAMSGARLSAPGMSLGPRNTLGARWSDAPGSFVRMRCALVSLACTQGLPTFSFFYSLSSPPPFFLMTVMMLDRHKVHEDLRLSSPMGRRRGKGALVFGIMKNALDLELCGIGVVSPGFCLLPARGHCFTCVRRLWPWWRNLLWLLSTSFIGIMQEDVTHATTINVD